MTNQFSSLQEHGPVNLFAGIGATTSKVEMLLLSLGNLSLNCILNAIDIVNIKEVSLYHQNHNEQQQQQQTKNKNKKQKTKNKKQQQRVNPTFFEMKIDNDGNNHKPWNPCLGGQR
jgi:hypothetical protein